MAPGWWGELSKRPALVGAMVVAALGLAVVAGPQVRGLLPRPAPRPTPTTATVIISPGFADVAVPLPSPTPVPLPDLGPPPAGIPLIWIEAPNGMVAYTWGGRAVGTLHTNYAAASPDGQVLWTGESFVDAAGHVRWSPRKLGRIFTWASGSDGVCGVAGGQLWTYRFGAESPRSVRAMPSEPANIAACSFRRDLALVTVANPYVSDLYWIRLHDGAVLGHRSYAADAVGYVTASPDLRYFAENYVGAPHPGNQTEVTAIRRVSDGSLVASRDDLVLAFSADDSEIVTGAFNAGTIGVFSLNGPRLWAPSNGPGDWAVAAPFGAEFGMVAAAPDGQANVLLLVLNGAALPPITIPDGGRLLT